MARVTDGPSRERAQGQALAAFVDQRVRDGTVVYPARVFRARARLTAFQDVRVVILGQDPYHGPGQAQGLAFSVAPGQKKLPPSLRNMLKEVQADTGAPSICRDDLTPWAQQGVLLLNTALTVEDGAPQSHAGRGWEALTDALLGAVAARPAPTVFMLWGASAQRKRPLVEQGGRHPGAGAPIPRRCRLCARRCRSSAVGISARPTHSWPIGTRACRRSLGSGSGPDLFPAILRGSSWRGGRVVNGSRL